MHKIDRTKTGDLLETLGNTTPGSIRQCCVAEADFCQCARMGVKKSSEAPTTDEQVVSYESREVAVTSASDVIREEFVAAVAVPNLWGPATSNEL